MVAGLSDTVGYTLEDRALQGLLRLLPEAHGITVEDRLVRRYVEYPEGGLDEVNIFGRGHRNGTNLTIVGKANAKPGKRDVDRFLKLVARLQKHGLLEPERFLFVVGYSLRPEIERYARSRGVEMMPSYLLAAA